VKKSTITLVCAATLLSGAAVWAAAGFNFHPGKWQLTMATEMEGQPPMQPMIVTKCEQAQEAATPEALIAKLHKSSKCQASDVKISSDKGSWSFTCQNGAKGTGEMVFATDTYESTMHMSMVTKKGPMKVTQHVKGKRIGDC
jgi:hypothetical protein